MRQTIPGLKAKEEKQENQQQKEKYIYIFFTTSLRSRAYDPSLQYQWPFGIVCTICKTVEAPTYLGLHWKEVEPYWNVPSVGFRGGAPERNLQ